MSLSRVSRTAGRTTAAVVVAAKRALSSSTTTTSATAAALSPNYSIGASYFHWLTAVPIMISTGAVLQAQRCEKKSSDRQYWMHYHESFGVLSAAILVPRLAYRVLSYKSYVVQDFAGTKPIEEAAKKLTFTGLHAFSVVCAGTGVAMNYLSGWGLPFFQWKIPGIDKTPENKEKYGKLTYQMYDVHKLVGNYGKWLIPIHVAGTGMHAARGHAVMTRINPFRKVP